MQRLNRPAAPAKLHITKGRAQIDEWALLGKGRDPPVQLLLLKPLRKEEVLTEEGEGGYREEPPSEGGHRGGGAAPASEDGESGQLARWLALEEKN